MCIQHHHKLYNMIFRRNNELLVLYHYNNPEIHICVHLDGENV